MVETTLEVASTVVQRREAPPFAVTPRDYQLEAIPLIRLAYKEGKRKVVFCAPTGAGKSVIAYMFAHLSLHKGSRAAFLTNRISLIRQTQRLFAKHGMTASVLWAGAKKEFFPSAQLQLIALDTLRARAKVDGFIDALPKFDVIFVDELHLVASANYQSVIALLSKDESITIGLTATPWDRPTLKNYTCLHTTTPKKLMEQGHLVPAKMITGSQEIDTSKLRVDKMTGDYAEKDTQELVMKAHLYADVVATYKKWVDGKRAIVFAAGKDHAKQLADEFEKAGYKSAVVIAETPAAQREFIFDECRAGRIQVLCSVDALSEGLDIVEIEAVLLCRPTKSVSKYVQRVGRGARPAPHIGKLCFYVLDFVGSWMEHGLPYDHRPYYLSTDKVKNKSKSKDEKDEKGLWKCKCGSINEKSMLSCPACGKERKIKRKVAVEVVGQEMMLLLESGQTSKVDVRKEAFKLLPMERKKKIVRGLAWHYQSLGKKPGMAWHVMKDWLGEELERGIYGDPESPPPPEVNHIVKWANGQAARKRRAKAAVANKLGYRKFNSPNGVSW